MWKEIFYLNFGSVKFDCPENISEITGDRSEIIMV